MPLFSRRRLQLMLDEIAPQLSDAKSRDLLNRLENKRIDQVLPAELELAFIWTLARLGSVEIEPQWWSDERRPDVYTESLLLGERPIVEIAAPNDNAISGEEAMDGVALRISEFASSIRRGIGNYLYFRFREENGYEDGYYYRRRLAPSGYELREETKHKISAWIENEISGARLRITEPGLDVEIEKTDRKQIRYHNTWSSMPPETHSIDDNPLYKLLERKLDQLRACPPQIKRFIFLGDAGSTLLNRIGSVGEFDPTGRRVSGRDIISNFVERYRTRVDSVVVIAPVRRSIRDEVRWNVTAFNAPGFSFDLAALEKFAQQLPLPWFEAYQVRSLFRQGLFSPSARGWRLGFYITTKMGGPMIVKVSARAFLDLLAGRINADQFRHAIGERNNEKNIFKHWLDMGFSLQDVTVESGGIDAGDDFLVLSFADDPAARLLRLPVKEVGKDD